MEEEHNARTGRKWLKRGSKGGILVAGKAVEAIMGWQGRGWEW